MKFHSLEEEETVEETADEMAEAEIVLRKYVKHKWGEGMVKAEDLPRRGEGREETVEGTAEVKAEDLLVAFPTKTPLIMEEDPA